MKFTTTTALLLATGITTIAAMPWSTKNSAKTPSHVFEEDITLRIEVVPKTNNKHRQQSAKTNDFARLLKNSDDDEKPEICWRACFGEEPNCPEGWHAKQFGGECWTCCKTIEEDSLDL
ncbi:hypothetical protein GE21DRAFT_160 [Neurospora crassa]|uniref:Uncharacterized protein n=1 Tax=Neurospora crassa (strain ATCC 24698 / 74-OR23-1A / CBS 708.71 / DSM 1257 / FGSC 987) TaxID=367110 RepID=Q7SF06_NEUCR|nr:hypothetical protein NCU07449 [Neurospora crassa OR74A]EAA35400.1 hypothetical protein NCU07449 [Neurospora crassa OR74A]KHE80738.1 hypothetical protein GE21DRAFT_160 [Neurospora crassa]|eukprot:XP_964636.1 hypothetical protein NCU07449 [Neurospora crassa OR74A]